MSQLIGFSQERIEECWGHDGGFFSGEFILFSLLYETVYFNKSKASTLASYAVSPETWRE